MKATIVLAIVVSSLGLVICQTEVGTAAPMGTSFTYQGRLIDANDVADGEYDFQFRLYNDPCSGLQLGSLWVGEVDVIDGYFTVELDFGSEVFDGSARWLDIGIRPGQLNEPNAYTPLIPRQEVSPTPYALFAGNADTLDSLNAGAFASRVHNHDGAYAPVSHSHDGVYSVVSHTHDGRYYTQSQLQTSGTSKVHWNNLSSIPVGFADGQDDVGPGSLWSKSASGIYYKSGDVGIGVTNPACRLDVYGAGGLKVTETGGAGTVFTVGPFGETTWNYGTNEVIRIDMDAGPSGYLQLASGGSAKVKLHSNGVSYFNGGNVGIGTVIPTHKLEVLGDARISGILNPAHSLRIGTEDEAQVLVGSDYTTWAKFKVRTHGTSQAIAARVEYETGDRSQTAVVATAAGNTTSRSCGVSAISSSSSGDNRGVTGQATTPSTGTNIGVYGLASNTGTGDSYAGYFEGHLYCKNGGVYFEDVVSSTANYRDLYINSDGKLGYYSSSRRYKENISVLEDDFSRILEVQPATFTYKESHERGIGLIAEDLDELGLSNLVFYDEDGEPDGVRYEQVSLYLLEVLKDQTNSIAQLKAENDELKQRLNRIEQAVSRLTEVKEN